MLKIDKQLNVSGKEIIVSFDLEWTKNYKIKNGNQPFCFSFVFFPLAVSSTTAETTLDFGFYLRYVESKDEIASLVDEANKILGDFLNHSSRIFIIGHQLSSDIAIVLSHSEKKKRNNFVRLKKLWQTRKEMSQKNKSAELFDSRYDIDVLLKKKSRKLVDICKECHMGVVQPEITSSMTKMQNDFYVSGDIKIMEKLSVLNIRHSLSAAILFLMYKEKRKAEAEKVINVNQIIYRNLANQFDYVCSEDFRKLL